MNRYLGLTGCVVAVVCAALGCTWTRFDDVTDNPPVERLEAPNGTSSLGMSMAIYPSGTGTKLAVAASDRLVFYDLGTGTAPSQTATNSQSCVGDNSCILSRHLVGLGAESMTGNLGCVAYGLGIPKDSGGNPLLDTNGKPRVELWLYCEDSKRSSLPLPPSLTDWFPVHPVSAQTVVEFATTRHSGTQPLVAAMPDANELWFYSGTDATPVELPPLPNSQSAGQALAIVSYGTGYVVAASSSNPADTVWFYQIESGTAPVLTGCISGPSQLGRLLATGKFDADDIDDLLVADATTVYLIAGSSLVVSSPGSVPACTSLDSARVIAKVTCSALTDLDGCVGQPFAAAVAAANLDGTAPDELVIGDPNTVVRGENAAGAVFIYQLQGGAFNVKGGLYVSSATAGDRLGTSLAAAPVGKVEGVMAGSPGDNSVMAFYCNSLLPADSKSARCP